MGAAYLAGLAVGYWKDTAEIRNNWAIDRSFIPQINQNDRAKRVSGWKKAVRCTMDWEKD
jgi:glycerol kinase